METPMLQMELIRPSSKTRLFGHSTKVMCWLIGLLLCFLEIALTQKDWEASFLWKSSTRMVPSIWSSAGAEYGWPSSIHKQVSIGLLFPNLPKNQTSRVSQFYCGICPAEYCSIFLCPSVRSSQAWHPTFSSLYDLLDHTNHQCIIRAALMHHQCIICASSAHQSLPSSKTSSKL